MSQGHKGSRLLIKNQLVPVLFDSAHFNFNQDANGIQLGDMIQPIGTPVYTIRPFEGKFGGGIAIEEATTNLLTSTQATVEGGLTGLSGYAPNGGTTLVQDTTSWEGTYSAKCTNNWSGGAQTMSIHTSTARSAVTSGNAYTFSVYTKNSIGATSVSPTIWWYDSGGVTIVSTGNAVGVNGGRFERASVTGVAPSGAVSAHCELYLSNVPSGGSLWWDGAQFENKGFSTSFVIGSRVDGYTSYPKEIINLNSFTISTWVNFSILKTAGYQPIFELCSSAHQLNRLLLLRDSTNNMLTFWASNGSTEATGSTSISSFSVGVWHMVTLKFDGASYKLYIDGQLGTTIASTIVVVPLSTASFNIGGRYWSQLNGIIDDFRVDATAASDEEILAWYISNSPFYNPYDYRAYAY